MKLSNTNATHLKIPLSQIRETGNVRKDYDANGIAELAESIKNNGLLNPLTVKPGQADQNGNKTYELIAGHRRLRAYQLLCENGDDFSMVECCVRPGKKIVLQMIENIQRQDITPREKEEAVKAMLAEGYTQSDIARELSKPIAWVSDIVAGTKVREVADQNDIDTDGIATKTLSQLRSIPAKDLPAKIKELSKRGGTFREATEIMNEAKGRLKIFDAPNPLEKHPDAWKGLEEFQAQKLAATTNVSNDEGTIEPQELSEAEWNYREERDRKEARFIAGTEIDTIGKRLFFKDLWVGRNFAMPFPIGRPQDQNGKFIVAQVTSFNGNHTQFDCYWWTDERDGKGHNMSGKTTLEDFLVDSDKKNSHFWIYEIPDDALPVKIPDMQPADVAPSNTQSKGFKNPIAKQIQTRWQFFCRSKKLAASEKTAFAFYQELVQFFENTYKC